MKEQKGITLIALIITIIVMLILVGVTINVALNGGLFEKAKTATFETEMAQIQEQILIAKAVKIVDNDNTEVTWSDLDLPQELKTKYQSKLVISGNKLYYDSTQITSVQEQAKYETIGIAKYIATPEDPTEPEVPSDVISEETDFTYENGTITGLSATGKAKLAAGKTTLVIPATIGENKITKIGDMAFAGMDPNNGNSTEYSVISSITVSEGIEIIGMAAFVSTNIKNIEIPEGVTTIGTYAFTRCNQLTTINLPSTLTAFGYDTDQYEDMDYLTKIQINNTAENIKAIEGYPFSGTIVVGRNTKDIIYDKDGNLVSYSE